LHENENRPPLRPHLKVFSIFLSFFCLLCIYSCTKLTTDKQEVDKIITLSSKNSAANIENSRNRTNPLSKKNLRKEKKKLNLPYQRSTNKQLVENRAQQNDPEFIYLKFNPQNITQSIFKGLENDSTSV
jgi:hypothetical protein